MANRPHTYTHAPRPVGGPITFTLDRDRLKVDSGRKLHDVRLGAVEAVRMTYEPKSFAQRAYRTKVRMKDGKTFAFSSLNWRSFVEAERLDAEYRDFARALLNEIADANPQARFVAGRSWPLWIGTAMLAAVSLAALCVFLARALQAGATSAAMVGAFIGLAGIWQLEPMLRLNRPRSFTPDKPPKDLLP
jgi:hypothetical protein